MWEDLSFKERAELINQWRKEHVTDYAKKKREYNEAHKFEEGGDTNPMNYKWRGTIHSDELKNQGITHVAKLPEVTVIGRDPNNYRSSYDPMALYKYGVEPALEGMGMIVDRSLHPIDVTFDTMTSPAWWLNKAITGNSDNTVQAIRDWTHQAVRDAGMILSPTRDIGTLRTGFEYAPWNPDNPGIAGNDEVGQAMNNTFDIMLAPLGPKVAYEGARAIVQSPRARAVAYNNITPYSYGNQDLGTFQIRKFPEIVDTAKEFFTPKKIDVSYPKWKQRYDQHLAAHPEEANLGTMFDYDNITLPAAMEMRDQAWAKAMRQPSSDRWTANIYKDNGDGTVSYDLDAVDAIRTKYGSGAFSGEISEHPFDPNAYADNITTNGGGVNITKNPDGTYRMQDIWDTQPLLSRINSLLNPDPYLEPTNMQKVASELPPFIRKGLKKVGEIDAVDFLGGDPFKLDMSWDPMNKRFWNQ